METLMQTVNLFDLIVGSVVLILAFKGFLNGVVKEVFGLAGLVGGVYLASRLADEAARWIDTNIIQIDNVALSKLTGFMSILIIVWLSATLLGAIFSKLTNVSGLGLVDRLLGFVVGGGKYFIIFALITTALSNVALVNENIKPYVKDSKLYPILVQIGQTVIRIDPKAIGLVPDDQPAPDNNAT